MVEIKAVCPCCAAETPLHLILIAWLGSGRKRRFLPDHPGIAAIYDRGSRRDPDARGPLRSVLFEGDSRKTGSVSWRTTIH